MKILLEKLGIVEAERLDLKTEQDVVDLVKEAQRERREGAPLTRR